MKRLAVLALLAASCAGAWTFAGAREHPALTDGATLATFERGLGTGHERRVEVRSRGEDFAADSVADVLPFLRPIDTPEAAIAYSELAREMSLADSGAVGALLRPDPSLTGPGGNGRYSHADAAFWGVEFLPTARLYGGGFEVTRVVLLAPVPDPAMPRYGQPWRVVLLREVVFADGRIRPLDQKTLTNGQDAARFATL